MSVLRPEGDAVGRVDGVFGLDVLIGGHRRAGFGDPTCRRVRDGGDERWWWAARTPEGLASARFEPGRERLEVHAFGPGAGWVAARAGALVGADDDPSGFVAHHPPIADALRRRPELRIGRTGLVVDSLVPTVLGQRVTGKGASDAWRSLVFRYGERAPGPVEGLWTPPDPERLANEPYYALHPFGVERTRATTVIELCRRRNRLDALAAQPAAVATERLLGLRGVGPWTAAIVVGSSHGDPDAVPVGDFHLPNAVAYVLAGEPRGDDARMLELLAPYAGHRARAVRLLAHGAPKYGPRAEIIDIRSW